MNNEEILYELQWLIISSTMGSSRKFIHIIEKAFGKDSEIAIWVFIMSYYEFLYFYIHVMNRTADKYLDVNENNELFKNMLPLLLDYSFHFLFKETDKSQKEIFFEAYNVAEVEYAKCNTLMVEHELLSKRAILTVLVRRIHSLFKRHQKYQINDFNLAEILRVIVKIVVDELVSNQHKLDILIKKYK